MTSEDVARRHGMSDAKAGQLSDAVKDPSFAAELFDRMLSESVSVINSAYRALEAAASRKAEAAPAKPKKTASKAKPKK